jgi:unsaturated rhamnogalacturonyl hydrolase
MYHRISPAIVAFHLTAAVVQAQADPSTLRVPVFRKDTLSIVRTGARGDGQTLDTRSIQRAIDSIHRKGGGVVLVPQGLWRSGPLVLRSHVNLHLRSGALLSFTDDRTQYPLVAGSWEGLPQMRSQSPISARGATDIAITGEGVIDGNGAAWRMVKKEKTTEGQWKRLLSSGGMLSDDRKTWYPSPSSLRGSKLVNPGVIDPAKSVGDYQQVRDFLRPNLLVLERCRNILLEGVTFRNSPAWCLHPMLCENLTVRRVRVENPWYAQNGDGIDVESCTNVRIEHSVFDVGDDALCLKSGRDAPGRARGVPTRKVSIRNCTVYSAHGGFVIGSEMSGGVQEVDVRNCTFIGTDIGLRFKTVRGRGGVVRDVHISDIVMQDIQGEAILFDMYYMAKDPVPAVGESEVAPDITAKPLDVTTPSFRGFTIERVRCTGAARAIFVRGLPEMNVSGLRFRDMNLTARKGVLLQEAFDVRLEDVSLRTEDADPVIDIMQSRDVRLKHVRAQSPATAFLRVNGDRTTGIVASGADAADFTFPVRGSASAAVAWEGSVATSGLSVSRLAARTAMNLWPDSFLLAGDKAAKWRYDQGVILKGVESVWLATGERAWFDYIQRSMDFFVDAKGDIRGYRPDEYNIDHINNGKLLLLLHRVTGKAKYKTAADRLREQLRTHPRTSEGGFWHKKIYPHQMWLDGLYMAQPFLAEYARTYHEDSLFHDIVRQFELMDRHGRSPDTEGLLRHGWDESRSQRWADPVTGLSPHPWGRSLGWYGMALVDVLDHFPEGHPRRAVLVDILGRFVASVLRVRDRASGVWYDIPDQVGRVPNYPEASGSAMLTYTIGKAARLGYIDARYRDTARQAWQGLQRRFLRDSAGLLTLSGTVSVSGLGGNPYRDGSFGYYMSEPVIDNDPKGLGALILCAAEMELPIPSSGKPKTVLLDNYLNSEWRSVEGGAPEPWHYLWDDRSNGGFHVLGHLFRGHGARTALLRERPTRDNLRGADVFLIVDPDTDRETAMPKRYDNSDISAVREWVAAGGTLVLLGNDSANAELPQLNALSKGFGITFEGGMFNAVVDNDFPMGAVVAAEATEVFGPDAKLFVKELSTLALDGPAARPLVTRDGKVVAAVARHGKGRVFALGDPWAYNEYVDGRKLPEAYRNHEAAAHWVRWLLGVTGKRVP